MYGTYCRIGEAFCGPQRTYFINYSSFSGLGLLEDLFFRGRLFLGRIFSGTSFLQDVLFLEDVPM